MHSSLTYGARGLFGHHPTSETTTMEFVFTGQYGDFLVGLVFAHAYRTRLLVKFSLVGFLVMDRM